MRPRGNTQRRYNEAIQTLSGKRIDKKNIINNDRSITTMAVKRRQGCPQTVLHLWDAVAYIRQQKQIPNFERLSAYMKRVYNLNPTDLERQLNFAVFDGLINIKKSVGCKGSKVGIEQDGYRIPEEIKEKDSHDWYCFECHRGGEVILCTSCHRVFHEVCIKDSSTDKFICSVCKNYEKFSINSKKNDLNGLLTYTCVRLKEKTRELHRIPHPDEERWRYDFLIYAPMDLTAMEDKVKANEYTRLGDFYTDAQQIVHNVIVYFGMHSPIAGMAWQMLNDCEYDLNEIIQCRDCYRMSNTKTDKKLWFCQPCDPPHELVYAKIKGFPYWPAKVISKKDHVYDVRFFGAFHQRAYVEEDHVKPISTSFQKLGVKKTASFNRAYGELRTHQELVEKFLNGNSKSNSVNDNIPENNNNVSECNGKNTSSEDSDSNAKTKAQPRKRKSTVVAASKPPPAKKTATVPLKKNKKFYQESPTSSSPKNSETQEVLTPEDHNIVSSSSQEASLVHISVGIQTPKELLSIDDFTLSDKQQDAENTNNDKIEKTCDCSAKYDRILKEIHARLDEEHKEDKSKALKEFAEKLRKEMESEKQKSLALALDKLQHEQKEVQRKTEEQRKAQHQQEIRKIIEQHNIQISEIKKKQWCYNCEAEAIYHCCWNTSYCSVDCQQVHWHKEHKRTCRRKR